MDGDEMDNQASDDMMDDRQGMGQGQDIYGDEDEEQEFVELDEEQLRALLLQHQRIMNGEDPGEAICDENGEPIQLTQEEYEAALEQLQDPDLMR